MRRMKKPSPALVVAALALAVATSGVAGAASGLINGSSIKPHSITSLQLAAGAVQAKNVSAHAITRQALASGVLANNTGIGPAGATGQQGPAGRPPAHRGQPARPASPEIRALFSPSGGFSQTGRSTLRAPLASLV